MIIILSVEETRQLAEDGLKFIHRVASNEKASPAEIKALPEVMRVLCGMAATD